MAGQAGTNQGSVHGQAAAPLYVFSGSTLKIIAVVSMVIDHIGAAIIYRALGEGDVVSTFVTADNYYTWSTIYWCLRGIGRLAFPLFGYLLVEGFLHTKSAPRYALRLLLFAALSEIPFNLALKGQMPEVIIKEYWFFKFPAFASSNVFFTLLMALLAMMGMAFLDKKLPKEDKRENRYSYRKREQEKKRRKSYYGKRSWASDVLKQNDDAARRRTFITVTGDLAIALTAMIIAQGVLSCDYGATGVLSILIIYLMRDEKYWIKGKPIGGMLIAVLLLGLFSDLLEFVALLDLLVLWFYNGERGKQPKYLFYIIYPGHLLLLLLVCVLMGLSIFY